MPPLRDTPPKKPLPIGTLLAGALVFSTAIGLVVLVDESDELPPPPPDAPHLHTRIDPDTPPPEPEAGAAPLAELPPELPPRTPGPPVPWTTHDGVLEKNQTLGAALEAYGVTGAQVHRIVAALDGIYDFRTARPGAAFTVKLDKSTGQLAGFRFEAGPLDVFEVVRAADDTFEGRRVDVPVELTEAEVGAEIRASLYRAMQRVGESPALVALITDVFAWDIDFYRNTHPGDRFRVIVEKVTKDGEFIRYGRILAAEYTGQVGDFRTFWFVPEGAAEADGHYYLADGQSAEKTFLATPLKFARVSSGFGLRKHPVLGYTKAHMGVDYAAPTGTPVWAMAAGTVTWAAWKGPNGKLVRIDHGNGLESAYAHLSRIPAGIKKGTRVRQKQVIGYVGTTGRSTGPHLHFAIKRSGRYIDPAKLKISRGKPVPAEHRAAFDEVVARRTARLADIRVVAAPHVEDDDDGDGPPDPGDLP